MVANGEIPPQMGNVRVGGQPITTRGPVAWLRAADQKQSNEKNGAEGINCDAEPKTLRIFGAVDYATTAWCFPGQHRTHSRNKEEESNDAENIRRLLELVEEIRRFHCGPIPLLHDDANRRCAAGGEQLLAMPPIYLGRKEMLQRPTGKPGIGEVGRLLLPNPKNSVGDKLPVTRPEHFV
jgi:hypothetical protein